MFWIVNILWRVLDVYAGLLLIYAILSWFPQLAQSRFGQFIAYLVEPVLKPFRTLPLQVSGIDLTVVVVLLVIRVLQDMLWVLV